MRHHPKTTPAETATHAGVPHAGATVAATAVVTAVVAVLTTVLLLSMAAGVALAAPPWPDASNAWWLDNYGITETQVGRVADGYEDGRFRPDGPVARGQFAKMASNGLGIDTLDPSVATFLDVPRTHTFFTHIEGTYAGGLITGYPVTGGLEFRPGEDIQRQQTNSILGRHLSGLELAATGVIHGAGGLTYASLALWYAAQGDQYLNKFLDAAQVAEAHRPTTAYLISRRVVQGSKGRLSPVSTLNRAQAAAMVLRVGLEAGEVTVPPDPDGPSGPGGPPSGSPLDARAAVGAALADIEGGVVIEIERDTHRGQAVWEVVVRDSNGRGVELYMNVTTGEIIRREVKELPWYARDAAPTVDIRVAMATALAVTPGTIEEVELDWESGRLVWEVEIITAGGFEVEVDIDATTGRVIR